MERDESLPVVLSNPSVMYHLVMEKANGHLCGQPFEIFQTETVVEVMRRVRIKYMEESTAMARAFQRVVLLRRPTIEAARLTAVPFSIPHFVTELSHVL